MTCGNCTAAIERALRSRPGVISATATLQPTGSCTIKYDGSLISADDLREAIEDAGFDLEPPPPTTISMAQSAYDYKQPLISAIETTTTTTSSSNTPSPPLAAEMLTTIIAIQGMTCGSCTAAIERQVNPGKVAGLTSFAVSLISERASAVHDGQMVSASQIVDMIEDCGFDAQVISSEPVRPKGVSATTTTTEVGRQTAHVRVYGLEGESGIRNLHQSLATLPGIIDLHVDLPAELATIEYDGSKLGVRDVVEAIGALGYTAILADSQENATQLQSLARVREVRMWRSAFWASLRWMVPVFFLHMIVRHASWGKDYYNMTVLCDGLVIGDLVSMGMTIPIQFGTGLRFYQSAWRALRHGSATMDVLVVFGTTASFAFSLLSMAVAVISPVHPPASTFFDTSAMLITFVTFGRYLENKAKGATSAALSRLMSLAPSTATIYVHPNHPEKMEERTIPTELVQVSDIVLLRPGSKVPADGVVVAGDSWLDESMITGESRAVRKQVGDTVAAGTVNGRGRLDIRITRTGRDTQLAQIVRLVQDAQTSRAPIQRFSDRVAGYFVPIILTLSICTFFGWLVASSRMTNPPMMFMHAGEVAGGRVMACLKLCVAVVVVACPCALGLATPTAVMVGTGMAAARGILIKGGPILEVATRITHCLLDKTGTLTHGRMAVMHVRRSNNIAITEHLWWTLLAAAEQHSEHPTGRAVCEYARSALRGAPTVGATSFEAVAGRGVRATVVVDGVTHVVFVGNARFLTEQHVSAIDVSLESTLSEDERLGHTCIHIAIDSLPAGYIALADTLRPDAHRTVQALLRLNIKPLIVTGDRRFVALRVAAQLQIPPEDVFAECSPSDKQSIVRDLQALGSAAVMVVGDGINDSPALASADLGCALSDGAEVAVEAADMVLMRQGRLVDAAVAVAAARAIYTRIKWNLVWAAGYNLLAVPVAMGLFLPIGIHMHPPVAAALMAASSISVVCSSLLLRYWTPPAFLTDDSDEDDDNNQVDQFHDTNVQPSLKRDLKALVTGIFTRSKSAAAEADGEDQQELRPMRTV
ncbi:Cu(2+)-transporting P-type ATPase [Savitreella phatthalungensis]